VSDAGDCCGANICDITVVGELMCFSYDGETGALVDAVLEGLVTEGGTADVSFVFFRVPEWFVNDQLNRIIYFDWFSFFLQGKL
jgi:hypothetical protein